MSSARVAKRYARALLELAAEQNHLEDWGAELQRLAQAVTLPDLAQRLNSPELPEPQRSRCIVELALIIVWA